MSRFLIDTDVLIDWLRGRDGVSSWMRTKAEEGAEMFVSGITVAEIFSGTSPQSRTKREKLLSAFSYAPLTFEVARLAGELRYKHLRSGTSIALPDLIQAATAKMYALIVATANSAHFPDVETVNPRRHAGDL